MAELLIMMVVLDDLLIINLIDGFMEPLTYVY